MKSLGNRGAIRKAFQLLVIFMIIGGSITVALLIIFSPKFKDSGKLLRGQREVLCTEYYPHGLFGYNEVDRYVVNNFRIEGRNVVPKQGDKYFPVSDCEPIKRIGDEIGNNK